jgi:hypothetical protein
MSLTVSWLFAQNDSAVIAFDVSIRERFESWNGLNAKNYGNSDGVGNLHDNILLQKIIAGFNYTPNDKITISTHLQDSRAFGWSLRNAKYPNLFKIKEPGTETPYYVRNPNEEFFEIHDLFFEYKGLLNDSLIIKAGRQKIYFGDKRIFGPGEWGNTGSWSWDAIKFSYSNNSNYVSAFIGGTKIHDPQKTSIPFTNTEFWGGGIYAHYHFPNIINIEPFYAYKTAGSADYINTLSFQRHWTGVRLFYPDYHSFAYDFTIVKEFGHENNQRIDAYAYVAQIGYQFKSLFSKPKLSLRRTFASGGTADNRMRIFDPVYGSRDSYYGRMNLVKWSNMTDNEIVLEIFPLKKISIEMSYNRFQIPSPENVTLLKTIQLEQGKHYLGDELDIFIRYKKFTHFEFIGVFGYFLPGNIMPINNQPAKNSTWCAFQVLYAFNQ